ncbi:MAG: hypothetical protein C4297_02380 [Gemmataceae bacterium]
MHWGHPELLWLLVVVPVMAPIWLYRGRRVAWAHPRAQLWLPLCPRRVRWTRLVSPALRSLLLTLFVLGAAQPRIPDPSSRSPAEAVALQIVLDVSGSMGEDDFPSAEGKKTRLQAAKEASRYLVSYQRQEGRADFIGLVTFAARPLDLCPPVNNPETLEALLQGAQLQGLPPESSTNIGDALALAVSLLRQAAPRHKSLLLLTDGEHNVPESLVPGALSPVAAARMAQALGIRIDVMYLGAANDAEAQQARTSLQQVAALTGGQFYDARALPDLPDVVAQLHRSAHELVETHVYTRNLELFPWLALGAVTLGLALLAWESSWGFRWP